MREIASGRLGICRGKPGRASWLGAGPRMSGSQPASYVGLAFPVQGQQGCGKAAAGPWLAPHFRVGGHWLPAQPSSAAAA
jgi:hypothetical protein